MEAKHPTLGNGKVRYIEIPAIDINASAAFYKEVFGWQIRQRSDGQVAFDDGVGEVRHRGHRPEICDGARHVDLDKAMES